MNSAPDDWELIKLQDSHWEQGFALPRVVRKAGGVVQTCCLKTHRYGGHFTLSLKNSVGLAAKYCSRKFLQFHARAAFFVAPAAHDRGDQHRI